MVLKLGDEAPNFQAVTTTGNFDFYEHLGTSWGILFSHPADFTPVCTTELAECARLQPEFQKRDVKTLAYSCDTVESHLGWIKDIESFGNVKVEYPIIAGDDRKVAALYGMIDNDDATNVNKQGLPMTVRSVFFISPEKKIKCVITYPASTGRNFDEIIRVIDSLQMAPKKGLATPVNWKAGERACVLPFVKTEEAVEKFGKDNVEERFPYLRFAKNY